MDEKECLTVSGYQQSEHESELDGLETVVRNVIPILNSPILALLAVPVCHLQEETKKMAISKEKTIMDYNLMIYFPRLVTLKEQMK